MELVFIGFGEAAFHLALGLRSQSDLRIGTFDANASDPQRGALIHERATQAQVTVFDSLAAACHDTRFVVCLTSASSALSVAQNILPLLKAGQNYVDMNSAAPSVKQAINALPRAAGVSVCDAAVMGTVPGNNHRVPMLLAGDGAQAFHETFTPLGMRLSVLPGEAGAASAIKMLKSIVMKGLPQLLLEAFQAAEKFQVLDTLVESLGDSLNGQTVEQLANTFTARTLIHAKRRSAEMDDVVATLEGAGVDAAMSRACQAQLEKQAARDWGHLLGPKASEMDYRTAIQHWVKLS